MKIAMICGTRPEAVKLIPVYLEAKKCADLDVMLIATGQHREMLRQVFDFFQVKADIDLSLMLPGQQLPELTASLLNVLTNTLRKQAPDLIIVQGDTTSAMVGAMVGLYEKIKVAHVEAGLRTYQKHSPFPEEFNRRIISLVADFHFAPTSQAVRVLKAEKAEGVFEVGNTGIDSLHLCQAIIEQNLPLYQSHFKETVDSSKKIVLVTGHRRESFGEGFRQIGDALVTLAKRYPELQWIYPVHLNPQVRQVVFDRLAGIDNIRLIEPLPYDYLIYLMNQSHLILTDSGGIQEEAPSLNVPLIVMREHTERPEGIAQGCAVLAGTTAEGIVTAFREIYENEEVYEAMKHQVNPYGDGQAAGRIMEVIKKAFHLTCCNDENTDF